MVIHERTGSRPHSATATVADASFGARGLSGLDGSVSWPALFASGAYTGDDKVAVDRSPDVAST